MGKFTVDSLVKYYDNNIILNDVAFEIKRGEIMSIFGRNGSGKTTLINSVLGIVNCDYVFRRYDEEIVTTKNINKYFCYSSQKKFLPDYLNIKQLLKIFNIYNDRIINIDSFIKKSQNLKLKELSYGQQFYVQLFMVIHSNKKICILDEPFSGLSPKYIDIIIQYIKQNSNKTFIITDHNIEKLFEVSNRKFFLKNGKLINVDNYSLENIKQLYY